MTLFNTNQIMNKVKNQLLLLSISISYHQINKIKKSNNKNKNKELKRINKIQINYYLKKKQLEKEKP